MDITTIIIGIGVLISLVLGVHNLLARREKVAIVNSDIDVEYLHKGSRYRIRTGDYLILQHPILSIEASCELVLTGSEGELEVKEVELILDKNASDRLKKYFRFPLHNSYVLDCIISKYDLASELPPEQIMLKPKRAVLFKTSRPLDGIEKSESEMAKTSNDFYKANEPFLVGLMTDYQICWTRYDGKRLCWRFPDKWWRNLGKKIWG